MLPWQQPVNFEVAHGLKAVCFVGPQAGWQDPMRRRESQRRVQLTGVRQGLQLRNSSRSCTEGQEFMYHMIHMNLSTIPLCL